MHLFARFVEPERRLLYLLLEDVEAFPHFAELVVGANLDRYDVDRNMCSVELAAAQGCHGVGEFSQHPRRQSLCCFADLGRSVCDHSR